MTEPMTSDGKRYAADPVLAAAREIIVAGVLILVAVIVVMGAFYLFGVKPILDRGDCRSDANADTWAAVAAAFDAPPAPNPARGIAVKEIETAAKRGAACS